MESNATAKREDPGYAIASRPKPPVNDSSRSAVINTVTVADDAPNIVPEVLWKQAYEKCKLRESDLVNLYEQHMKAYTSPDGTASDDEFSPRKIAGLIKAQRGNLDARRLSLRLGGKSFLIREQVEKIVNVILFFDGPISSALASQPYASLAWSGVSIILPLLLNSSKQSHNMMDGLQKLSDMLITCDFREKMFPREETTDAYLELTNASVELYSYIFEYEARCVCHLFLQSARRGLEDLFEKNDWIGMLKKIAEAERIFEKRMDLSVKRKDHRIQERQTEIFQNFQKNFLESREYDLEARLLTAIASNYESDKDSIAQRVNGTCEWFFRDERFHRWRDTKSSSLLWISAGPGCGKSVLAKALIDECRLSSASALHTTTCYFFFREGEQQRTTGANALSAILHQLFDQNPHLIGHGLHSSKFYGHQLSSTFSELWNVLIKTAEDEDAGQVICVLDALDECDAQSTEQVIDKIIHYYDASSHRRPSAGLKFLITSRPYSRISFEFERLEGSNKYVHLDVDENSIDISHEINLVIDHKVPRLTRDFEEEDRERISSQLKKMNHQTYLWLYLTLNIIEREQAWYSKAVKIEKLLSNLPLDVSDAYAKLLSQSREQESARTLLQIIIAATRPLTLAEANVAWTMATQDEKSRDLKGLPMWPEKRFASTVQEMCGLLVSVNHGRLSLLHQTARTFLLQAVTDESNNQSSEEQKWSRCFTMESAQEVLCSICVEYLTLDDFAEQAATKEQVKKYREVSLGGLSFFDYAASSWDLHYRLGSDKKDDIVETPALTLCKPDHNSTNYWFQILGERDRVYRGVRWGHSGVRSVYRDRFRYGDISEWSPIGLASLLGLADVVQHFLAGRTEVDQRAGPFETAVRAAIIGKHVEVVRLLCQFNTGARFQHDPGFNVIALQAPNTGVSRGERILTQDIAKLRISEDLLYAIGKGAATKIMRILLEHEFILGTWVRPSVAVKSPGLSDKQVAWIRLLLEFRADPNIPDNDGRTPLHFASKKGNLEVVRLFLQAGADINMLSEGKTPVFLAKKQVRRAKEAGRSVKVVDRYAEVVQFLRHAGAKEDLEEGAPGEKEQEGEEPEEEDSEEEDFEEEYSENNSENDSIEAQLEGSNNLGSKHAER